MIEKIEFAVGEKYRNRKGLYEVISRRGDKMVIQWEDGEKVETSVEFQRRIIDGMRFEKKVKEEKKLPPKKKSSSRKVSKFKGLSEGDFKNNITKTKWRGRPALGGAVTQKLDSDRYTFNSWAVYRIPSVHWADAAHRDSSEDIWRQAKFFAQVDEHSLFYGFYIERPDDKGLESQEWKHFLEWLKNPENEGWLKTIAEGNGLLIFDKENRFEGTIEAVKGEWKRRREDEEEDLDSLYAFIDRLPEEHWLNLQIAKRIKKEEALERKEKIADDISSLFMVLMPLYEASVHMK